MITLAFFGLLFATTLQAQKGNKTPNLKELKNYIEQARKDWNIPGMAVAIVKDDSVVFSEGFGVRSIKGTDKVDGNTAFAIASNTKAYTAACIAMLVDEGKLSWDDPVTDYLPWFELYDPYVTEQMKVRDLLCHRTGLATFSGDLIWYGSTHSRQEVVRRAKFLKPQHGFRENFGYSNIMYLAAGLVVEKVSGTTWDDFISQRIFKPLGMNNIITSTNHLSKLSNLAMPHNEVNGKNIEIEYLNWDNIAPAGSIITSVNEHAKWIKAQLGGGKFRDHVLWSSNAHYEMMKPHTVDEFSPGAQQLWPGKHFELYGLGWGMFDYYGYKVLNHGGGYDGMISQTVMVPELKLGFVILTNNINSLPYALMYQILEQYIQPKTYTDWSKLLLDFKNGRKQREMREREEFVQTRKPVKHALPLESYAGNYESEEYGSATVSYTNGNLSIQFDHTPIFSGTLTHWHFETFEIVLTKVPSLPPGTCMFTLDESGKVETMKIDIQNPDFDFTEFHFVRVQ